MKFAERGARRYAYLNAHGLTYEDFIGVAYEGLIVAARTFRADGGCLSFSGWAFNQIDGRLKRAIRYEKRQKGWMFHKTAAEKAVGGNPHEMPRLATVGPMPTARNKHGEEIIAEIPAPPENHDEEIDRSWKQETVLRCVDECVDDVRTREIWRRRLNGETFQAIGHHFGISHVRVRQLFEAPYDAIVNCVRAAATAGSK